jgi:hypothetical protein
MSLSYIASLLLAAPLFILWFLLDTHIKTDNVSVQGIRSDGCLSRTRHLLNCR